MPATQKTTVNSEMPVWKLAVTVQCGEMEVLPTSANDGKPKKETVSVNCHFKKSGRVYGYPTLN